MKKWKALKYLMVFSVPATALVAFSQEGWLSFLPAIYAFGFVPILELAVGGSKQNLEQAESEIIKVDRLYDMLLYLVLPIQWAMMIYYLFSIQETGIETSTLVGRTVSMGILCGLMGINVAHELGHRSKSYEQNIAKGLLLSSLYMHFFIEHNRGHHKNASTPEDPASARFKENVYSFILRSMTGSYKGAWDLEAKRLKRAKEPVFSWYNQMLRFQVIQLLVIAAVALILGPVAALFFMAASFLGAVLLETVNYIEHYGLLRNKVSEKRYENVSPAHSWNSNHYVGRLLLFELSRHSDHHAFAHKKYQVLEHHNHSPQMPTGYPGMMLLSWIPPLWFLVMNPKVDKYSSSRDSRGGQLA